MVLAREAEVFAITAQTHRVNLLQRRLESHDALAVSVGVVKAVKGPYRNFVILAFFFETFADGETVILLPARDYKLLIDVVRVAVVKQPLLLQWRVKAQKQVGLGEQDLLGQLGVAIEVYLTGGIVGVPPDHSVQAHYRIWLEGELLFADVFWVLSGIIQTLLLV